MSSAKRHVSIHLTPFAPGVGAAAIGDKRRWMTFWSVAPARAMAELCHRLRVEPHDLVLAVAPDAIELTGPSPAIDGARAPIALITYGLELGEIREALSTITAARQKAAA